jgi:ATP-dependent exoDNAse (exonuclease V) beta subunit
LDREWISGQIDRVILERDANDQITAATVLDFKTDTVHDEAAIAVKIAGYGPQLSLYRTAVARLTGLARDVIRAGIIFTTRSDLRWVIDGKA